mmetsp:Transcript_35005/g.42822  ORF Transcript_35005/g.42822 Transcript_35005/m.42822 type:complete len:146 (+) Transcript_35005:1-438(+)
MTLPFFQFDIHTRSKTTVNVEIYTKEGSHKGFETNKMAWTQICKTSVMGQGLNNVTIVPSKVTSPVVIPRNSLHSFYITLDTPDLRYTFGVKYGSVFLENDDLIVYEGKGSAGKFGTTFKPRVWNGIIHYSIEVGASNGGADMGS